MNTAILNTADGGVSASLKEVTVIANDDQALDKAAQCRSDFPTHTRLVSIEGNVLRAVSVAYRTASGLHSTACGQITKCIYNLPKVDIALLIAENDPSDEAFDRAAFEVARDAFVSGNLEAKATILAKAAGRAPEACYNLIQRKLADMTEKMNSKSNHFTALGEVPASPEAVRDAILASGGKYLLNLPTGYGKTSKILEPVLQEYLDAGKRVLVISHRRSINKNIANLPGMVSYDECTRPSTIENAKGLKIVVNSIANHQFKAFVESADLVVIDEASQVIAHALGGEIRERQAVWNTLNFVVKNTADVIMSDADIDSRCREMIGPSRLFSINQNHSNIKVVTGEINRVRAMAIAAATSTVKPRNVLIACDVVKEGSALAKSIEKVSGVAPLVINADNAKWTEQAAFIADPNSSKHRVVIYSPVITSALSITSGHFSAHFGLFQGLVIPRDAIQMLRRNRTASLFVVGIKHSAYSKSEAVEISFKKERVRIDEALSDLPIDDVTKARVRAAVYAESKLSGFKAIEYKHCADEAWMKDNIQNTLPSTLLAQGFRIRVLAHNEALSKKGFVADSQGRKAVKKEIVSKLLASAAADRVATDLVTEAGSVDEAQLLTVIRARAEEVMDVDYFTAGDAKVWGLGEGESKIRKFRQLFNGVLYETSGQPDVLDLLRVAVATMTETSTWNAQSSIELFDKLNAMRSEVIGMGIKIGSAKSDQAKQADITKILSQFGLKSKKRQGTNSLDGKKNFFYVITPDSLAQMNRYI